MPADKTRPVLVFLHGAGVDHELWAPQVEAFSKDYHLIVPDLPGHGTVPVVDSVEEMAEHVRTQIHRSGLQEYSVIGLSMGGMVALEMAQRWPDEVTHLAMIESVPNVTQNPFLRALIGVIVGLLRIISPKLLASMPARSMGAETAEAGAYVKRAIRQMQAENVYRVMKAALAYDGRAGMAKLDLPTLIMVGEKNKATHKRAKAMAEEITNSRFVMIPKAGHIANRDGASFVNSELAKLFESKHLTKSTSS
ncbi:MAG: alpha/beta hydrolase [Pseudomonadota bacterium]